MRNIYSCIDIGSDSIKVVVCELFNNKYNLLATSAVKSSGIKKGLIVDVDAAKKCIKHAITDIETVLGFRLKRVIAIVPSYFAEFKMVSGTIKINNKVVGSDVVKVLQNAMKTNSDVNKEMVTTIPIDFALDNLVTKKPLGKESNTLRTRAIMVTTPKRNVYSVVELLSTLGIEVVDVSLGCIGDINTFMNSDVLTNVSCVVNIGAEKTEVSLYNKGIIVKHSIINMGSKNVDSDIAYMYKIDLDTACSLKEDFALANKVSSTSSETREFKNKFDQTVKINQYELSEIVYSRLSELFDLVNKEINSLTQHKPKIIFVTGGITNMTNFSYICREKLGKCAIIGSVSLIGLRNNKFSQAIGNIKYFVNKLKLSDENYSMVDRSDSEILSTPKINDNDSVLGKLFGYFFGE